MYNKNRTIEVFGYDLETMGRRTKSQVEAMGGNKPKDMPVIDNCPGCNKERQISYKASRKNKQCSKCFHNSPEMKEIKLAQKGRQFTEEHKQKMRDNHWSAKGMPSPFKGKHHTKEVKLALSVHTKNQFSSMTQQEYETHRVKSSLQKGRTLETFNGFTTPEGTRIRQSEEGKAWIYDVLGKCDFTCQKCKERGSELHAHHKNGFNLFPEHRFDVENGACLCNTCHEEFHKVYGKGDNTEEQYDEWIATSSQ